MAKEITQTREYREFVTSLKQKVQAAQIKAARAVNTQLIALYWELGKLINEKQHASGWGDAVIDQIAKDLRRELGGLKGFSRRNLYYMRQFYRFYAGENENMQQLAAHIPWGHHMILIDKMDNPAIAFWYLQKTAKNNWSRNVLALQIDSSPLRAPGHNTAN